PRRLGCRPGSRNLGDDQGGGGRERTGVLLFAREARDLMRDEFRNPFQMKSWPGFRQGLHWRRIRELQAEGQTYESIAAAVELHPCTVARQCRRGKVAK